MPSPLKVMLAWQPPRGIERIAQAAEGIELLLPDGREDTLRQLPHAEVALVAQFDAEMLAAGRNLRWIQAASGGVEHLMYPEMVAHPARLTSFKPCFDVAGAEYALATMLAFARRLWYDIQQKPRRAYEDKEPFDLKGKTVGIVGLGNMGAEVARRARCFGMRVIGLARTPRPQPDYLDELLAADQLPRLLAASDFVVIAVPNTPQTRGMIGAAQLQVMKPTAYLIDVSGRAVLYDLDALARAVRDRQIAGAALQMQPPAHSPLWELDNVILSWHRAVSVEQFDACIGLFCENLRRYRAGQPLLGQVDKAAGY